MKPENAIEVKDLYKMFKVYQDKGTQLKERLLFWRRNRYEKRQVLEGVSFEIKKGETVGLIGYNGCGKSTTLKLLSKIIYPDSGNIALTGRISCLIELGAGFHPDMSGRENIYINAAIFGLGRKEIERRMPDIIAFSELEPFIDNPVRTYSSGMYMRLAFSVAINVDADILLIDEILAVGDAAFQEKCFERLKEIHESGATILIVSHSREQIEDFCDRCIWIDQGKIRMEGETAKVTEAYMGQALAKASGKKETSAKGEAGDLQAMAADAFEKIPEDRENLLARIESNTAAYFEKPQLDACHIELELDEKQINREKLKTEGFSFPLTIHNLGTELLTSRRRYPIFLSYRIEDAFGNMLIDGRRTDLNGFIGEGESETLEFRIDPTNVCAEGKEYQLTISLVAERLFWFDQTGQNMVKVAL